MVCTDKGRSKLKTYGDVVTLRTTVEIKESVDCECELLLSLKPFF